MHLSVETDFPWNGEVKITLRGESRMDGTLAFRIPGWSKKAQAEVRRNQCTLSDWSMENGKMRSVARQLSLGEADLTALGMPRRLPVSEENIEGTLLNGYLYLTGEWHDKDEIYLTFPMETRCIRANTKVREDIGKVAFLRGPICYCMEEADNGKDLHLLRVDPEGLSKSETELSYELGHEMCVLKVSGKRQEPSGEGTGLYTEYVPAAETDTTITLLPYYAWNNRGEGEMSVWIRV